MNCSNQIPAGVEVHLLRTYGIETEPLGDFTSLASSLFHKIIHLVNDGTVFK